MPRYFFDFDDGETNIRDEVGIELDGIGAVENEAMILLYDIIHLRMPVGQQLFIVRVRDRFNVHVYRGKMKVKGQRF